MLFASPIVLIEKEIEMTTIIECIRHFVLGLLLLATFLALRLAHHERTFRHQHQFPPDTCCF